MYTHQQGYLIKIGIWIPDTIELLRIFIIDIKFYYSIRVIDKFVIQLCHCSIVVIVKF